jgi:hypothetical protein
VTAVFESAIDMGEVMNDVTCSDNDAIAYLFNTLNVLPHGHVLWGSFAVHGDFKRAPSST